MLPPMSSPPLRPSILMRAAILLATLGLPSSRAQSQAVPATAQIEFRATSTLKDFSGHALAEPFTLMLAFSNDWPVLAGTASVAVANMDTRHAARDENMRKMFAAPRFPFVTAVLPTAAVDPAGETLVLLDLTIRDRTTPVHARLSNWRLEQQDWAFDLQMEISLKAVGLTPPVFMGLLRVGDRVAVHARFRIKRANGGSAEIANPDPRANPTILSASIPRRGLRGSKNRNSKAAWSRDAPVPRTSLPPQNFHAPGSSPRRPAPSLQSRLEPTPGCSIRGRPCA
jgi:polyisoprenoid-binding protein YceI